MRGINPSATKWSQVAALAARQHGVLSRTQIRAAGVTDAAIEKAVRNGRLHRAFRGVFGVGHPLIGERAQTMAAVLACGPDAFASHLTAAHLLGLRDRPPSVVELISHGDRGRGIDGIRCHQVPNPRGAEAGHVGVVANGASFMVDFLWSERRLVVETDGKRFHSHPSAFESDRLRDRALQLAGYRVVRFTYRQVDREPQEVVATIRQLLDGSSG